MNSPEIKKFIREKSYLFWWIPEEKKVDISSNSLVEAILYLGKKISNKEIESFFNEDFSFSFLVKLLI
jgi:hypothetical protein